MTPFVWMFIQSYKKLREYIINFKNISSLIQFEYSAFSEATVPICSFVLSNEQEYNGTYIRLSDFKGGMEVQREKVLESIGNKVDYLYTANCKNYLRIPGYPIAYFTDKQLFNIFEIGRKLGEVYELRQGLSTGKNDKFLRYWFEIDKTKMGLNFSSGPSTINTPFKWFPFNRGGKFRKWYGNHEYVVDWYNNGENIKNFKLDRLKRGEIESKNSKCWNEKYYFKESISWSKLSSGRIAFRLYPEGFIYGGAGGGIFVNNYKYYLLGLLNSNITQYILNIISPTLNYEVGHISSLPLIINDKQLDIINALVKDNIEIAKKDWDYNEEHWNFKKHPMLKFKNSNMETSFNEWKLFKNSEFNKLSSNEQKLDKIYSEIYDLKIPPNTEDKFISVSKSNYNTDILSFISYAIGCMFGRYSLDDDGLQFAGGEFDLNNYHKFIPDDDNIIPVLDTAYFDDDIVGYFTKFVETCFGSDTLEENLDFIAKALSKTNKPSREIIRQYLLKNFFNDHKKTYKKCPIYWQFNSGKENGFNCLIYMHRYEPSLVARIRTDYLHKTQKAIEQRIENNNNIINNSNSKQEINKANKEKTKLQKQLKETQEYDEVLAHIANQNIEIDLDDGVKVNYAKFQNIEIKKEGSKTRKVNLLKKI